MYSAAATACKYSINEMEKNCKENIGNGGM